MKYLRAESDDGTKLRLARWGDGDRDVLLVHGLAEHAGRYEHVANALVAWGWRVTLLELRGHGESGGRRGHTRRWHRYVEDLQAAATVVGRPFVLVGHSMGGLVALSTLLEPITPTCRGLVLSNPLLRVKFEAPEIKIKAGRVLSRVLPFLPLSNELDSSLISRDPAVVRAYDADPLVFSTITPRWFTESEAAMAEVNANAVKFKLPLLMMVSDGDQICDHQASLTFAAQWGGDVAVREWPGLYHELFNEPEKDQVLAHLVGWLEAL